MALPSSIVAALLAVLLRSLYRQLPFAQAQIAPSFMASWFLNPPLLIVSGIFCLVNGAQCRRWLRHNTETKNLRRFFPKRIESRVRNVFKNTIEKPKFRLHNDFQGSKKLQEAAKQYLASDSEESMFLKNLKLEPTSSRFIPKYRRKRECSRRKESKFEDNDNQDLSSENSFTDMLMNPSSIYSCSDINTIKTVSNDTIPSQKCSIPEKPLKIDNCKQEKEVIPLKLASSDTDLRKKLGKVEKPSSKSISPTILNILDIDPFSSEDLFADDAMGEGDGKQKSYGDKNQHRTGNVCSVCHRLKRKANYPPLNKNVQFPQLDQMIKLIQAENSGPTFDSVPDAECQEANNKIRKPRGRHKFHAADDKGAALSKTRSGKVYKSKRLSKK